MRRLWRSQKWQGVQVPTNGYADAGDLSETDLVSESVKQDLRIAILGSRWIPHTYSGDEVFVGEVGPRLVEPGHEVSVYCRVQSLAGEAQHVHRGAADLFAGYPEQSTPNSRRAEEIIGRRSGLGEEWQGVRWLD